MKRREGDAAACKRLALFGGIDHLLFVPIPETTSAEAYESYICGKCLRACRGEAWRDIKAFIIASPRIVDIVHLPAVSEPFITWTMSGEAEFYEREGNRPWITHRIDVRSHTGTISWLTIISTALLWTPEASYFGAYRIANRGCENLIGPLIYKVFA